MSKGKGKHKGPGAGQHIEGGTVRRLRQAAQSEGEISSRAERKGAVHTLCVLKDLDFYFEKDGIPNHWRVLSKGEIQPAYVLTGSLWFLFGE